MTDAWTVGEVIAGLWESRQAEWPDCVYCDNLACIDPGGTDHPEQWECTAKDWRECPAIRAQIKHATQT